MVMCTKFILIIRVCTKSSYHCNCSSQVVFARGACAGSVQGAALLRGLAGVGPRGRGAAAAGGRGVRVPRARARGEGAAVLPARVPRAPGAPVRQVRPDALLTELSARPDRRHVRLPPPAHALARTERRCPPRPEQAPLQVPQTPAPEGHARRSIQLAIGPIQQAQIGPIGALM